jgi:predicted nucleic-acid-binding Zn-ribbon protein
MVNKMVYVNENQHAFKLVRLKGEELLPKEEADIKVLLNEYFVECIEKLEKYPVLEVYKMTEKNQFPYAKPNNTQYNTWGGINSGDGDSPEIIKTEISEIINADEVFLSRMDVQFRSYSNDDEHDFISNKTAYSLELIELILWQGCCYEMDNDNWKYTMGKCSKCGSGELYTREVQNEDFQDKIICKMCGTEFIR